MFGAIATLMVRHNRAGGGLQVINRSAHVVTLGKPAAEKCSCSAFKIADHNWTQNAATLRPIWNAAVKVGDISGYQLYMNEAIPTIIRDNRWPACPSASGGFCTRFVIPDLTGPAVSAKWIGQVPPAHVPDAIFTEDKSGGDKPCTIQFTDHSTGDFITWSWTFGDGGSSSEQNPTHVYTTAGTYTVTLTIAGPGGTDDMIATKVITSGVPPGVQCTYCTTGTTPANWYLRYAGFTGALAFVNGDYGPVPQIGGYPCNYNLTGDIRTQNWMEIYVSSGHLHLYGKGHLVDAYNEEHWDLAHTTPLDGGATYTFHNPMEDGNQDEECSAGATASIKSTPWA